MGCCGGEKDLSVCSKSEGLGGWEGCCGGEKEFSVCSKFEGLGGWVVVGLQCFFHTLDPGLPWSSPCLVPRHFCVVSFTGKLMRCHACQVPKPSDSLLLDVVENLCCSNHFSDLGVPDLGPYAPQGSRKLRT